MPYERMNMKDSNGIDDKSFGLPQLVVFAGAICAIIFAFGFGIGAGIVCGAFGFKAILTGVLGL